MFKPTGRLRINMGKKDDEGPEIVGRRKADFTPRGRLITQTVQALTGDGFSVVEGGIIQIETGAIITVEKDDEQFVVQVSITKVR